MDLLLKQLQTLKVKPIDMVDRTFRWKRIALSGSVKGADRHYPIEVIGKLKRIK